MTFFIFVGFIVLLSFVNGEGVPGVSPWNFLSGWPSPSPTSEPGQVDFPQQGAALNQTQLLQQLLSQQGSGDDSEDSESLGKRRGKRRRKQSDKRRRRRGSRKRHRVSIPRGGRIISIPDDFQRAPREGVPVPPSLFPFVPTEGPQLVPPGGPQLISHSEHEMDSIVSSIFRQPLQTVRNRFDMLGSDLSIATKVRQLEVKVVFDPREASSSALPIARCLFSPNRYKVGQVALAIDQWCSQLFSWLAYSIPGIKEETRGRRLTIKLKEELRCSSFADETADQVMPIDTEILWGRIAEAASLTLPRDLHYLIRNWSPVAVVKSRRVDSYMRTYVKQHYAASSPSASEYMDSNPLSCLWESPTFQSAMGLGNAIIEWPPSFQSNRPYMVAYPMCLAAYPEGTIVTSLNEGETTKLICDKNRGFIPHRG